MPLVRIDRVDWLLVASDLRSRREEPDFVVGPGPASFMLARYVRQTDPGRVLDLGCGSGIQSLLLAASGGSVVALDINPRALAFTRFNAALNGIRGITVELGDFLTAPPDPTLRWTLRHRRREPAVRPRTGPAIALPRPTAAGRPGRRADRPGRRSCPRAGWSRLRAVRLDRSRRRPMARTGRALGAARRVPTRSSSASRSETPADDAATWNRALPDDRRASAIHDWTRALEAEGVRSVHLGRRSPLAGPRRADPGHPRFARDRSRRRFAVTAATVEAFLADRTAVSPPGRAAPVAGGATSGAS